MSAIQADQVAHAIEHLAQATKLLAQVREQPADGVAAATQNLVQATWTLAEVTAALAFASTAAVVVPVIMRLKDRRRADSAALTQLITIMRTFGDRLQAIIKNPLRSEDRSAVGTNTLFTRALQPDIAQAVRAVDLAPVLGAIAGSYQVFVDTQTIQDAYDRRVRESEEIRRRLIEKIGDLNAGTSAAGGNINIVNANKTQISELQRILEDQAAYLEGERESVLSAIKDGAERAKTGLTYALKLLGFT